MRPGEEGEKLKWIKTEYYYETTLPSGDRVRISEAVGRASGSPKWLRQGWSRYFGAWIESYMRRYNTLREAKASVELPG